MRKMYGREFPCLDGGFAEKVKFSAARGMDAGGGIIAPVLKDAENGEKYV